MMKTQRRDGKWITRQMLVVLMVGALGITTAAACKRARTETPTRKLPGDTLAPHPSPAVLPTFALSLTALQQEAERHPQALSEALVTLGGVNRLRGLMLEPNGEIIILGDRDLTNPLLLHLDDVAAVWRNAFQTEAEYAGAPLGVSIDPQPGNGRDPWTIQQVRVFGMPRTARMAQRQVAIDYDLKKVSAGIMALSSTVTGTYDLMRAASPMCTGVSSQPTESVHRFWFCARYPEATPRFAEEGGTILIVNPVGVQLLTEREFLDRSGNRSGSAQAAPQAETFSQLVSQVFTTPQPPQDYQHLLSDFRLIELAQVLKFKNVDPNGFRYLLHEHRLAEVEVPEYVGGVRRHEEGEVTCATQISERPTPQGRVIESKAQVQRYNLTYRGGVEAKVAVAAEHIRPEAPGAFAELRRRVRESRPASGAWLWKIR
jgi:hypothetical protein